MDKLVLYIESLIFAADPSISFDGLKHALEESFNTEFADGMISDAIRTLMNKYEDEEFSIEITEIAGGFRFMTKAAYHHIVATYLKQNINKKLSKAALETLAIVSYKQPVSKTEIESIRGVNSDYSVQKLLDKDLIEITGRSDGPGRPLLYGTTLRFMDYFGLKTLDDLPKIKEIALPEHQIGEAAPIEEEQAIQKINTPKEED
ncbi:MAG: SMC-Scp complex subunit ScpB [Saprospiraceae bacterium]|nr:SMC-Scp complex subunit ScpB [Saprospiraceae bacterium]